MTDSATMGEITGSEMEPIFREFDMLEGVSGDSCSATNLGEAAMECQTTVSTLAAMEEYAFSHSLETGVTQEEIETDIEATVSKSKKRRLLESNLESSDV